MSKIYTVIDVSKYQGNIDFKKVKKSGIWGVVIRACGNYTSSESYYVDPYFEENYKKATAQGLHVGAYIYGARTLEGKKCAEFFYKTIKGKKFDLPVYLDIEEQFPKDKETTTKETINFCKYMENKGYYVGIYGSDLSSFSERLIASKLTSYDKWVARYGSMPTYIKEYGLHQYTSSGKINGISGNVDLNNCYKDYPSIIMKNQLNGCTNDLSQYTDEELAHKVINGDFGNGQTRKKKLGIRYSAVQKIVNELLK